jgi:hypothetical protein
LPLEVSIETMIEKQRFKPIELQNNNFLNLSVLSQLKSFIIAYGDLGDLLWNMVKEMISCLPRSVKGGIFFALCYVNIDINIFSIKGAGMCWSRKRDEQIH